MRFRQAHKSTTYGVAVSSFFAVAFSGLLPILLILLGAIAIAVSWWWEPPRVRYASTPRSIESSKRSRRFVALSSRPTRRHTPIFAFAINAQIGMQTRKFLRRPVTWQLPPNPAGDLIAEAIEVVFGVAL